jgi:PAS domain S-box-containing protein
MGQEIIIEDGELLVSETDGEGIILYSNRAFEKVSGYTLTELHGKPHNIVRHPDMPSKAFEELWSTIKSGKVWTGYVKNYTKNRDFYWVYATIYPYKSGNETHYMSCRRKATPQEIQEVQELYEELI